MAFKMRGRPVISGTGLHKNARSSAIKKAADDHLRQQAAQQAQGSVDPNTPLALRGRLQDKINERLNRNVTIGTRIDPDTGEEIVTKTVERDRLFGGGRTSRTRDKRNWDIENVAPENRARQIAEERTVDQSQERVVDPPRPIMIDKKPDTGGDYTGPIDVITPGTPIDFPIEEGKKPFPGPGTPIDDPIGKLPPDMQDELVGDLNEGIDEQTLAQKYGGDVLEALLYVGVPGYGAYQEGSAAISDPEGYIRGFETGLTDKLADWWWGDEEEGIQSSGSGQAGGNRPVVPPYRRGPWMPGVDYPYNPPNYWHWNSPGSGVYKKRK